MKSFHCLDPGLRSQCATNTTAKKMAKSMVGNSIPGCLASSYGRRLPWREWPPGEGSTRIRPIAAGPLGGSGPMVARLSRPPHPEPAGPDATRAPVRFTGARRCEGPRLPEGAAGGCIRAVVEPVVLSVGRRRRGQDLPRARVHELDGLRRLEAGVVPVRPGPVEVHGGEVRKRG